VTHVFNTEASFKDDALQGFVAAYARYVELVPETSAVQRVGGAQAGRVSVIGGGGSGHYPAFCGLVGPGLLAGAVVGNVFSSPSAEQAYRSGWALDGGAGVLFAVGNYAGDVLNFEQARERLIADGVDARCLFVTDDVASAGSSEAQLRRGIAGDLSVYKIAGALADTGATLDEVQRIAIKSNDATRTFGVAFAGCTLPGHPGTLFSVEPGRMEIGLGIHGEPGIRAVDWMPAHELAQVLVAPLLAERPVGGSDRAAVLLNGLGATKYEELFVLWRSVSKLLEQDGVQIVLPEVGELVTSLDMAGCSLTLTWLDAELEPLWAAPCDSPGFRRGQVLDSAAPRVQRPPAPTAAEPASVGATGDSSQRAAAIAGDALVRMLAVAQEHEVELGRLDAVAGDGDHGVGLVRGLQAAVAAVAATPESGVADVLARAARAWADEAGGTSGMLWGVLLVEIGVALDGIEPIAGADIVAAVQRGADRIQRTGGAQLGDKTMLDVLLPFVEDLSREYDTGRGLHSAWAAAAATSEGVAARTADLSPRIGRARPLAHRSVGSPDPGAVSMSLCLVAAGDAISAACTEGQCA
jgi:dihydroxyacetone kinase